MLQTNAELSSGDAVAARGLAGASVCKVAALGLDPRMESAMELLFKSRLEGRFVLAARDEADLHLIDLDRLGGRELWREEANARPDHPLVLLAMQEVEVSGKTHFVRKPLKPQELIAALTAAAEELSDLMTGPGKALGSDAEDTQEAQRPEPGSPPRPAAPATVEARVPAGPMAAANSRTSEEPATDAPPTDAVPSSSFGRVGSRLAAQDAKTYIGLAADIDPEDPTQLTKAQFEPESYLIGRLQQALALARQAGRAARLELEHGSITLIPTIGQAMIDLRGLQLRSLAVIPLSEANSKVRLVDLPDVASVPRHRIWPLDVLLWSSALLASRGRVPTGTDISVGMRLKRWPNLTRLPIFPNVVRITALLARESVSLLDVARMLKVPQRCVFAFFAAASALELMERSPVLTPLLAGAAAELPTSGAVPQRRGLLHRILAHLRG